MQCSHHFLGYIGLQLPHFLSFQDLKAFHSVAQALSAWDIPFSRCLLPWARGFW